VDTFQEHLSWLITRANGADGDGDGGIAKEILVGLSDPTPPSLRGQSKTPVKGITFGGTVGTKVATRPAAAKEAKVSFQPTGRMWKALKEILIELNARVPEDFLLDDALGDDDLRVSLYLSCTKKKAQTTAGQLLTVLGRSLSHSDAPYTLTLADNTQIKGDVMKIKKSFGVDCVDHHPVHESMFGCIVAYMKALVEDGAIGEEEAFGNIK
jgi:hypothetical protein